MASFSGKIKLKGVKQGEIGELEMISYKFSANSPTDKASGLPTGRVNVSLLEVQVYMDPKTVMVLRSFFTNENISGQITFFHHAGVAEQKYLTVEIKNGRCAGIEQVFNSVNEHPFVVNLKLAVQSIEITAIDGGISAELDNLYTPAQ